MLRCFRHPSAVIRDAVDAHPGEKAPLTAYVADGKVCSECERLAIYHNEIWLSRRERALGIASAYQAMVGGLTGSWVREITELIFEELEELKQERASR